jgi:hypothetical protein
VILCTYLRSKKRTIMGLLMLPGSALAFLHYLMYGTGFTTILHAAVTEQHLKLYF